MSSLRPGRGHDSRKSVFYTSEEWELLDPSPKDLEESMVHEERKRQAPEGSRGMPEAPALCHSLHCRLELRDASGADVSGSLSPRESYQGEIFSVPWESTTRTGLRGSWSASHRIVQCPHWCRVTRSSMSVLGYLLRGRAGGHLGVLPGGSGLGSVESSVGAESLERLWE